MGEVVKIALVTTTINVPTVLKQYRGMLPRFIDYGATPKTVLKNLHVRFFIALDQKSPYGELAKFDSDIVFSWLTLDQQKQWKSSELTGFNTDSRRNFAILEALKWGAEIIVSIDDDMIPLTPTFFEQIEHILGKPFSGVCLGQSNPDTWLDAGQFTIPPARQRGLPPNAGAPDTHQFVSDVQVGAMQGIILGTPDTDAATTIVNRPLVHTASTLLQSGFVADLNTNAVFNSQITAFRRELAPAFAQFYKWQGRNTDIIASIIMRRIMRDRGLYTYYGPPMGYHARVPRDPQKDMAAEQWGLDNIRTLQTYLDEATDLFDTREPVTEQLRAVYDDLRHSAYWPPKLSDCALAWLDDCESVI